MKNMKSNRFKKTINANKVKRVRARADSGEFQKQCWMQNGGKRNNTSTIKRNDKGSSESSCLQLPSASLKAKYLTWWENNVWREEKHEDGKVIGTHSGNNVSLFRQEHPTGMKFQQTSQPRRILHRAFFAWIEQMQCQSLKNIMPRVGRKSIGKFRYAHSSSKAAGSFSIFLNLSHINSRMLALGQAIWPKFQPSNTIGMGIARSIARHWHIRRRDTGRTINARTSTQEMKPKKKW